jgi:hypothetical protein
MVRTPVVVYVDTDLVVPVVVKEIVKVSITVVSVI